MRKRKYLFLFFAFIISAHLTYAQNAMTNEITKQQKEFVSDYFKTFNDFITNPQKVDVNNELFPFYKNPRGKKIDNFLPGRGRYTSPKKMVKKIQKTFPDGMGMDYSADSIELVRFYNKLFSKQFVYKLPVEYSGFSADGKLFRNADNQYLYVTTDKKGKTTLTKQENTRLFKQGVYRKGLIVEPYSTFKTTGLYNGVIDENYSEANYNAHYENYPDVSNLSISSGVNVLFMINPNFGIGSGLFVENGWENRSYGGDYFSESATRANYGGSFLLYVNGSAGANGFYPDVKYNGGFNERINYKALSVPVFIRWQFGWPKVSFSVDAGGGIRQFGDYQMHIDGQITYSGVVKSPTYDDYGNVISYWKPFNAAGYGFGTYNYNNELVYSNSDKVNAFFGMGRFNVHIQLFEPVYIRLSYGTYFLIHAINDPDHNKSEIGIDKNTKMYQWDIYHLGYTVGSDEIQKSFEAGIGININSLLSKNIHK